MAQFARAETREGWAPAAEAGAVSRVEEILAPKPWALPPPDERLALAEICSKFSVAIFIKTVSLSELLQRLAWGDPWIATIITKGRCILPSNEFESVRLLYSQPLRFPKCAFRKFLTRDFLDFLDQAERATSLFFQLAFIARCLMLLGQILVVSIVGKEYITLREARGMGELSSLMRKLENMRVPARLLESFLAIASVARDSMTSSCWATEPSGAYLEVLHEWSAYVDLLVPEVGLDG